MPADAGVGCLAAPPEPEGLTYITLSLTRHNINISLESQLHGNLSLRVLSHVSRSTDKEVILYTITVTKRDGSVSTLDKRFSQF